MYKKLFLLITGLLCFVFFIACRKDKPASTASGNNKDTVSNTLAEDSLKYLMYQIMQVSYGDGGRNAASGYPTYFWYNQVPVLAPFDSKYPNADTLLAVMKRYAINPLTNTPYDRYSFLDRNGTLTNKLMNGISSQQFAATNSDFGFEYSPVLINSTSNSVRLYVLYADKNGPAGKVGATKGWEITAVNGTTVFTNTTASLSFVYNAIFKSTSSVTLGFKRLDGTSFTTTLNPSAYNINPVVFDTMYTVNNKNVGYFSMYTYASVVNDKSQPTFTKTVLDQLFNKFTAKNIRNLIVDLRYNGGGATSTAEYLDSAIAPSSAAGKIMYTYKYNDKLMANLAATGLTQTVKFPAITGGLILDNVFFITSRSTASASELTLNNLKPYFTNNNLFLVGDTTYGKPVGFIDFNISLYNPSGTKKYLADLYAINFATLNANGQGNYYSGIPASVLALDYVNVGWGDTKTDDNLVKIFNYLSGGSFNGRVAANVSIENNLRTAIPHTRPLNNFNGMVDYRLSKEMAGHK